MSWVSQPAAVIVACLAGGTAEALTVTASTDAAFLASALLAPAGGIGVVAVPLPSALPLLLAGLGGLALLRRAV